MPQAKSLRQYLLLHAIGYLMLIVFAGAFGGFGLYLWHESSRETLRLNSMMQEVQEMRGSLYLQLKEVFDSVFLADDDAPKQYREYEIAIEQHLAQLDKTARSVAEREAIAALRKTYQGLRERTQTILKSHGDMPLVEKQRVLNTELEAQGINNHERAINALEKLLHVQQAALDERLARLNRLAPLLLVLPILIALGLLVFSRVFFRRAVVAPLSDLEQATSAISQGELDKPVPERGAAELVSLARSVNQMAGDLAQSRESLLRAEKQAALGALVPALAHNIRNPIASIRATAQVLNDDAVLAAEAREDVAGIITTADRLERWTKSLLSYLHPLKARMAPCQITVPLASVLEMLKGRLVAKDLTVRREGWESSVEAMIDVALVEQAMHSLVLNAIEASPEGGAITLAITGDARQSEISILDDGPGIPFTPAAGDLSPGPTTKRYGTGLGIPFAMKVFEEHGGKVVFGKLNPRGTQVTITLPRKRNQTQYGV